MRIATRQKEIRIRQRKSRLDSRARWLSAFSLCTLGFLWCKSPLLAGEENKSDSKASTSHALLEQMDRETLSLYMDVQGGVVRLQLPPPKWLSEVAGKDNPVDK